MKILVIMSIGLCFVATNMADEQRLSNARIINGTEAAEGSHPWLAFLVITKSDNEFLTCGGSIITPRHVLTAAHCLNEVTKPSNVQVFVGSNTIELVRKNCIPATPGNLNCIPAKLITIHNQFHYYKNLAIIHDIALVTTSRAIIFTPRVKPICLPKNRLQLKNQGTKVTVAGWGRTSLIDPSISNVLRQVQVIAVPMKNCHQSLEDAKLFCFPWKGKGWHKGDSGSPIIWKKHKMGKAVQVGMVSYIISSSVDNTTLWAGGTDVYAYVGFIKKAVDETRLGVSFCTA